MACGTWSEQSHFFELRSGSWFEANYIHWHCLVLDVLKVHLSHKHEVFVNVPSPSEEEVTPVLCPNSAKALSADAPG